MMDVGDVVLISEARVGIIRYIGYVDGISISTYDEIVGIEIRVTDGVLGENNGTFNNVQYFCTSLNSGLFLRPSQIVKLYTPEVSTNNVYNASFCHSTVYVRIYKLLLTFVF